MRSRDVMVMRFSDVIKALENGSRNRFETTTEKGEVLGVMGGTSEDGEVSYLRMYAGEDKFIYLRLDLEWIEYKTKQEPEVKTCRYCGDPKLIDAHVDVDFGYEIKIPLNHCPNCGREIDEDEEWRPI